VTSAVLSFYGAVLFNLPLPQYSWTVAQDGSIHVQTPSNPTSVKLWQATNPVSRDLRRLATPGIDWTSTTLVDQGGGNYVGDVPIPVEPEGTTGYFVELTFANPIPQLPAFVFTTEIREKSNKAYVPWPFDPGSPLPSAVPSALSQVAQAAAAAIAPNASGGSVLNAAAVALAIESDDEIRPPADASAPILLPEAEIPLASPADAAAASLMLMEIPGGDGSDDAERDAELADALFGSSLDELFE
jgi:hypothetical protein